MADEHTDDPTVAPPSRPTVGWDADAGRWEHATLRLAVRHGVALFNDAAYHESHDCFEGEWYNYGAGSTESSFLHGMTQLAAGTYKHVDLDDDRGLRSLFRTALDYLEPVPVDYYGVDIESISRRMSRALDDPSTVDGWQLTLDGRSIVADDASYAFAEQLE